MQGQATRALPPGRIGTVLAAAFAPAALLAADAPPAKVDSGDTAWVLVGAALVMVMMPGLALFYGGLVRRKNFLSVLMQCCACMCIVSVQWFVCGYSLAFGPDVGGVIGNLDWAFLHGVTTAPSADYCPTVPHQAFMIYQAMFAIITPALIIGAFAERMKFTAFCLFTLLWSTLVYDPVAHWVWGAGGFLRKLGALDFAGGVVVHINAGVAALAAALYLGRRIGHGTITHPPHSLPFAVLGAGLLWFGWFGFNAGSALGAGALATSAFVATHMAAAMGGIAWAFMDLITNSRATVLGVISGIVAGLAAVTPAAGFVDVSSAVLIGFTAGILCFLAVAVVKAKLGYDDTLDAFGVHGVSGAWGAVATGLFATTAVNAAGSQGLVHGNAGLVRAQLIASGVTIVYSLVVTFGILKLVDVLVGLRVSEHDERIGLDLSQHRESSYTMLE